MAYEISNITIKVEVDYYINLIDCKTYVVAKSEVIVYLSDAISAKIIYGCIDSIINIQITLFVCFLLPKL